jgi:hypothetical protein
MYSKYEMSMNNMSQSKLYLYRHFYLYSKGHYKETDLETDLKVLCAQLTEHNFHNLIDIQEITFNAIAPIVEKKGVSFYRRAIFDYSRKDYFGKEHYSLLEGMIRAHLGIMQNTSIDEFGSFGEPDFNILPKNPKNI